jgi:hypothetical protein
MEANRPTPTDLHEFRVGQSRESVRQRLGVPVDSVIEPGGRNCDSYLLYTKGYGKAGKAGVALLEGTADVLTLGLSEIVLTPTEALTRNKKHRVAFCYSSDKLVRVMRTPVRNSAAFHQPRPVLRQHSKPTSTSSVSAPHHHSERQTSEPAAPEPQLPPTVIVPAS